MYLYVKRTFQIFYDTPKFEGRGAVFAYQSVWRHMTITILFESHENKSNTLLSVVSTTIFIILLVFLLLRSALIEKKEERETLTRKPNGFFGAPYYYVVSFIFLCVWLK